MEVGANVNLANRDGNTPLMAAAGLNASSIDTRGDYTTPLVDQNGTNTIKTLLATGTDINGKDKLGRTALHGAASWGWNGAVQYLVDQGADIRAEDINDLTPYDYALGMRSGAAGHGGGGEIREETVKLLTALSQ